MNDEATRFGGEGTTGCQFVRHSSFCIISSFVIRLMSQFAYLFERFPSFGQTFCYREVAELSRQSITPPIFSIRNPKDEPAQDWDPSVVQRVQYLPEEKQLLEEVRRASKKGKLTAEIIGALDEWGRRPDFLRLYQAVYNGLNLAEFGRTDFSAAPQMVVAVGRLIPKKGFADLIRACGLLAERGKSFQCEIIGDGPLQNEFGAQIKELNLQDRVALPGAKPQREVRQRLAAANIFVLPSVVDPEGGMDNLPTVIMEAMATGLPVVSTKIGGIPEMVVESETGFLVEPGDAVALANAIENLISDPALTQKMGRAGYERAQRLFSIERNVRELCVLLL